MNFSSYNFELYHFKVCAFFETQCITIIHYYTTLVISIWMTHKLYLTQLWSPCLCIRCHDHYNIVFFSNQLYATSLNRWLLKLSHSVAVSAVETLLSNFIERSPKKKLGGKNIFLNFWTVHLNLNFAVSFCNKGFHSYKNSVSHWWSRHYFGTEMGQDESCPCSLTGSHMCTFSCYQNQKPCYMLYTLLHCTCLIEPTTQIWMIDPWYYQWQV